MLLYAYAMQCKTMLKSIVTDCIGALRCKLTLEKYDSGSKEAVHDLRRAPCLRLVADSSPSQAGASSYSFVNFPLLLHVHVLLPLSIITTRVITTSFSNAQGYSHEFI